jgi:hypothetical protein
MPPEHAPRVAGPQGYAPTHNMHNVLGNFEGNIDMEDNATSMTITQTGVAVTIGGTLGNTYAPTHVPIHSKVSTAINQLLANQAALYRQMAVHAPPQRNNVFQVPPIHMLTIPGITLPFGGGGFTLGWSAGNSRHHECRCGCGGHGHTPFADHMAGCGGGLGSAGGGIPHF